MSSYPRQRKHHRHYDYKYSFWGRRLTSEDKQGLAIIAVSIIGFVAYVAWEYSRVGV